MNAVTDTSGDVGREMVERCPDAVSGTVVLYDAGGEVAGYARLVRDGAGFRTEVSAGAAGLPLLTPAGLVAP